MRVPKNVSVIPALDLFNMPVTLRPRGRERPGQPRRVHVAIKTTATENAIEWLNSVPDPH